MPINLGSKNRCGYFAKAALIVTYEKNDGDRDGGKEERKER